MNELKQLTALEQAGLVHDGEVTPRELVESAIARVEQLNPALNAVVTPMFDDAIRRSSAALTSGPLRGVPILIKDLVSTCAGVRHTEGSAFLADYVATSDSVFVRRLRSAGMVIIGLTNTSEFGCMATTEPALFGATRNPWDVTKMPGGSSGGSAAAVASGMVSVAHATDTAGSIRIPASCCGLVGLKPTRAPASGAPLFAESFHGFIVEHVLTRTVADTAAVLDAVIGTGHGHHSRAETPMVPTNVFTDRPEPLRIAYSCDALKGVAVEDVCRDAVLATTDLAAALGHRVEERQPDFDVQAADQAFGNILCADTAFLVRFWAKLRGRTPAKGELEPFTCALAEVGESRTAAQHLLDVYVLQREARKIEQFFSKFDLWVTPTQAQPPVPIGALQPPAGNPLAALVREAEFEPFAWVASFTGQPAISLPVAMDDALPIGVHVMARHQEERLLLRFAAELEDRIRWQSRWPEAADVSGSARA